MRVTLVISSLSSGGAERVISTMAGYWAQRGREVTLITLASEAEDFYALEPGVRRVALGLTAESTNPWEALRNNLRRLTRLRQEIQASRPDAVISFIHRMNVLVLLATLGLSVPVVVSERNDPDVERIGRVWEALRRLLYPRRASAVVGITDEVRRWVRRFVREEATLTIPVPVTLPAPDELDDGSSPFRSAHTAISMGRLVPQKGFDLLLQAFARCAPRHPDWSLVILGEGPERGRLEDLADELGIADRVEMPGRVKGPARLLRHADLFVLSSRREGGPNALVEALACGLPAVSFDCPSGPRHIIRDGVDGLLVEPENVAAFAATLERLMSDAAERERLGARAAEVAERFGLETIMDTWEDLLLRVTTESRA